METTLNGRRRDRPFNFKEGGGAMSVSDTGRITYPESTLCLKNVFIEFDFEKP